MPRMGSMAPAYQWVKKYRHLFPDNELFPTILREEETQLAVVVDAKLQAYEGMLDQKLKRLRGETQPPDQY